MQKPTFKENQAYKGFDLTFGMNINPCLYFEIDVFLTLIIVFFRFITLYSWLWGNKSRKRSLQTTSASKLLLIPER